MKIGFVRGALAGLAGTSALNVATYVDMAVRGRPASGTPRQLVETLADEAGVDVPGKGPERDNRLEAYGALSGIAVGGVVGSVFGMVHRAFESRGRTVPFVLESVLIGAAAMAASDVPLQLLGLTDARDWSQQDWISDAVPHLIFGMVTSATLRAGRA